MTHRGKDARKNERKTRGGKERYGEREALLSVRREGRRFEENNREIDTQRDDSVQGDSLGDSLERQRRHLQHLRRLLGRDGGLAPDGWFDFSTATRHGQLATVLLRRFETASSLEGGKRNSGAVTSQRHD